MKVRQPFRWSWDHVDPRSGRVVRPRPVLPLAARLQVGRALVAFFRWCAALAGND